MTDLNKKFDIQLRQGQMLEEQLKQFFTGQSIEVKSERYIWEIQAIYLLNMNTKINQVALLQQPQISGHCV